VNRDHERERENSGALRGGWFFMLDKRAMAQQRKKLQACRAGQIPIVGRKLQIPFPIGESGDVIVDRLPPLRQEKHE
jgi:hypothetical protein